MNCGDDIELTYTASSSTDKKRLVIGTENSVQELEARLCSVTGFSKVNIFFLGRQLNTSAHLQEQMKACGLDRSTHMLVQDASGGETQYPISEGGTGCSIFELTILEHFDELFSCMDSADYTSEMVSYRYAVDDRPRLTPCSSSAYSSVCLRQTASPMM
jgi:ubiquitin carboxyl-terminal hydrolase 34